MYCKVPNKRRGWNKRRGRKKVQKLIIEGAGIIEGGGKDHARREVPPLSSAPPLPTASTNTAVHPTTMIQTAILYCFQDATIRIRIFTVSGGADRYCQREN